MQTRWWTTCVARSDDGDGDSHSEAEGEVVPVGDAALPHR